MLFVSSTKHTDLGILTFSPSNLHFKICLLLGQVNCLHAVTLAMLMNFCFATCHYSYIKVEDLFFEKCHLVPLWKYFCKKAILLDKPWLSSTFYSEICRHLMGNRTRRAYSEASYNMQAKLWNIFILVLITNTQKRIMRMTGNHVICVFCGCDENGK